MNTPLSARARFLWTLTTWVLIALAQPGVLRPDGFGHLAFFAVGPWALAARRPGRRAFLAEWAAHALGLAAVFAWMVAFFPALLLPMAAIPALYPALGGALLRRAPAWPLALLAPAAWMLAEVVRWSLPVPLSFGWFRLGFLMHDTEWLVGSAAWFGTWGLTWTMAALGGLAADLAAAVVRPPGTPSRLGVSIAAGLAPLATMALLSGRPAPPMVEGPDVLVVQSGIEQEIKAARRDPLVDLFVPQVTRTLEALIRTRPAAGGAPDVVMWGETFLPGKLLGPGVLEAHRRGVRPAEWSGRAAMGERDLLAEDRFARDLVGALLGTERGALLTPEVWRRLFQDEPAAEWADRVARGEALLPPGTSFLSGVEGWTATELDGAEMLRSVNGVKVWSPDGSSGPIASKVHLVPGGESPDSLRGIPFVLDAVRRVASAVPDFVGAEEPGVLLIPGRDGRVHRAGIAVCFDNAFDDPFTAPLRSGPVDLFVVVSNEAWYGASPEMDHMLAFTRIAAAASRRAVVRATNSGISALVGPDGVVRDLVRDGEGRRKMIAGALRATVPVPRRDRDAGTDGGGPLEPGPEGPAEATFFVRTQPLQPLAWGGASALLLAIALVRRRFGQSGGAACSHPHPAPPESAA
ncbi:MAG: nitrilase-related carbon-nitrogen hydrolase [Planctomycetota bacterium]|jgi:apolipoprotein N-acyltransferase